MTHLVITTIPLLAFLATAPAAKEKSDKTLVPVVLRVDVSPLESAQEKRWVDHMKKIADRYIPPMLEQQGITLLDAPTNDSATVTIVVSWIDYQASSYATDITVTRPGFPEQKLERIVCKPCIDHMVVDQLEPHFPKVLPWLAVDPRPAPAEEPEAVAKPPAPTRKPEAAPPDDIENQDTSTDTPRRAPLGALGWASVASGSAGAAALIAGGVMFARGEQYSTNTVRIGERRDLRPPGVATMIVGGAALSAGVALLGVRLARKKTSRTSVTVAAGASFGAFSLIRYF